MLMYKFTQLKKTSNPFSCWLNLNKLLKSITGFAVVMLFLLNTNVLQAQIIDNETAVKAGFGIDGGVSNDLLEFGPFLPNTNPSPTGTDDWFLVAPAPGDPGEGVIEMPNPADFPGLYAGANVTAEFRMSALPYSTPEGDGRVWIDAVYGRDHYVSGGNKDATVYAQSINKNFDDSRSWTFKLGDVPAKTDIIDVYAHLRRGNLLLGDDGAGVPDEFVMVGAATADADGSNHIDFEFFRKEIGFENNNIVYLNAGDGEDCGHTAYEFDLTFGNAITQGDVLMSVDYVSGGAQAKVTYQICIATASSTRVKT